MTARSHPDVGSRLASLVVIAGFAMGACGGEASPDDEASAADEHLRVLVEEGAVQMAERVARPEDVCLGEPAGQDELERYLAEGAYEAGMWDVTLAAVREGVETSGRSIDSLRDEAIADLDESAGSGSLDEDSAAEALELTAAMFYFAEHPDEFDTSRYADLFVEYHSSCDPN